MTSGDCGRIFYAPGLRASPMIMVDQFQPTVCSAIC